MQKQITYLLSQRGLPTHLVIILISLQNSLSENHTLVVNLLRTATEQLASYFAGKQQTFDLPLDISHGQSFSNRFGKTYKTSTMGKPSPMPSLPNSEQCQSRASGCQCQW